MPASDLTFSQKLSQLAGHPVTWLFATLAIVFVAYIWMEQVTQKVVLEPVKKLSPDDASTNVQEAEIIIKQESMSITRESDISRAEEFLDVEELEKSTEPLFQSASQNMELGQYVSPEGDNAWQDYADILALVPDNTKASAGQTRIRNLLIDNADTAVESGDLEEAENWLVQLDVIDPEGEIQVDIRQQIKIQIEKLARIKLEQQKEQEKKLKIENSLAQAKEEEENYPINYNKIKDLYDRVLELYPENPRATAGLANIVDLLLDQAETALRSDSLDVSRAYLAKARAVNSTNKRLSSIELALDTKESQLQESEPAATGGNSANDADQTQSDAIDKVVSSLQNGTVVEDVTAEEVATQKQTAQLDNGIQAYYDGDYNKSFELLYPLAESGLPRAQFRIGVMYRYGRSVSQNADLSEKWFTKALPSILNLAQRGTEWAQTDLGTAYESGISLNQDFERAAYWYRKAAKQGYPGAQTNLGVLYANGEGVEYNRSEAVYWLKQASAQGDLVAKENLRIMGVQ